MKRLILGLFIPFVAAAEPGVATRYLMDEPVTMLDVSMMRLERLASEFEARNGFVWHDGDATEYARPSVSPIYDPDDDRFYIYLSAMDSNPDDAQMEQGCRYAMTQMNIWIQKSWSRLFAHAGQTSSSIPPDVSEALQNMFELRCAFTSSQSTAEGRFWAYRSLGNLGSSDMTIAKWAMKNE